MAVSASSQGPIDFQASIGLQDSFSGPMQQAVAQAESAMGTFAKMSTQVVVLNQAVELMGKAWSVMSGVIKSSIGEFAHAEQITNKLRFALAMQGEAVNEGVEHYHHLTRQMQLTSTANEDALLALAAQSKALGITTEMTDMLLTASVELSAVLGQDVDASFQQLVGTLSGMSKGLGRFIPAVKDMSPEMLKAGDAIKYVAANMRGFAQVEANTMIGQTAQIKNAIDQLMQSIGTLAASTFHIPGLTEGANPIAKKLLEIADALKGIVPAAKDARDAVLALAGGMYKAFVEVDWKGIIGNFTIVLLEAGAAIGAFAIATKFGALAAILPTLDVGFAIVAARVWDVSKAFMASAGAMAVAAVKFTLIAAGAVAIGVALDLIVRNFGQLHKLIASIFLRVIGGALVIVREIVALFAKMVPGAAKGVDALDAGLEKLAVTAASVEEGMDWGAAGKTWDEGAKFMRNLGIGADDTAAKLKAAQDAANNLGTANKAALNGIKPLNDENRKGLDELIKKTEELHTKAQSRGLGESALADLELANNLKKADVLDAAIKKQGAMTDAIRAQINAYREAANEDANARKREAQLQGLKDAQALTDKMQSEYDAIGASQGEVIANKLKADLKEIDLMREKLRLAGALTAEAEATLQAGEAKARGSAEKKRNEAFVENFTNAAKKAAEYFLQAMEIGAEVVGGIMSGKYIDYVASIVESIANLPDTLMRAFNRLDTAIANLITKFPAMLESLLQKLPVIVDRIVAAIPRMAQTITQFMPKIVDGLVAAIPKLIKALLDSAPEMSKSMAREIPKLVAMVMEQLPKIFEKLPEILKPLTDMFLTLTKTITAALPKVIVSLLEAAGKIIGDIIRMLPDLLVDAADTMPAIVGALVEGILSAIGDIVVALIDAFIVKNGATRIMVAFIASVPRLVGAILVGLWKGVKKIIAAFADAFSGKSIKMPASITDLPRKLEGSFKKLGNVLQADSSKLFAVKDFDKISKGSKSISEAIGDKISTGTVEAVDAIKGWWDQFKEKTLALWRGLVDGVRAAWLWAFDKVINPMIMGLRSLWLFVYDNIISPFITRLSNTWQSIYSGYIMPLLNGLYSVWGWVNSVVVQPMLSGLNAVWGWVNTVVVQPMLTGLMAAWGWVKSSIFDPMASVVNQAWQGIKDLFTTSIWANAGLQMWGAFKDGLNGAWGWISTNLAEAGKNVWYSLASVWDWLTTNLKSIGKNIYYALADVWSWLGSNLRSIGANIFYALADVWDWLSDNLKRLGSNLFGGGGGGGGGLIGGKVIPGVLADGGWVQSLAKGGPVYAEVGGFMARGTDTVPAMLTPGEFVVNRESAVANAGLLAAINGSRGSSISANNGAPQMVNLNITINARTTLDAEGIKREVLPAIDKHLKRRSLDGAFVLATAGVQAR